MQVPSGLFGVLLAAELTLYSPSPQHTHLFPNFCFSPGTLTLSIPSSPLPGAVPCGRRLRRDRGTSAALPGLSPGGLPLPAPHIASRELPKNSDCALFCFFSLFLWPFSAEFSPSPPLCFRQTHTHALQAPVRK